MVQTLREAIRQEYREVVERRVFTVTGNRPDEEVSIVPVTTVLFTCGYDCTCRCAVIFQ